MTMYAHSDTLDNGPKYIKDNCNKVILISAYTNDFTLANTSAKVAECVVTTADFVLSGVDGASRVLTCNLTGKNAGYALLTVANGANMHLVFVDTLTNKVLYVTEESSDQSILLNNPIELNSNPTYSSVQPTV